MGHVQDRQVEGVAQVLDVGQHLGLARRIERGQRLVHQQQPRLREQRAADRHPLAFATRQRVRTAREQRLEPEQGHHRVVGHARRTRALAGPSQAEAQVVAHRQVRKQPRVLEHDAEFAPVHRQVDAARGVEEDGVADRDAAVLGAQQPGDQVDQGRLAGAAGPEQRGQPGQRQVEVGPVLDAAEAAAGVDAQPGHGTTPSAVIMRARCRGARAGRRARRRTARRPRARARSAPGARRRRRRRESGSGCRSPATASASRPARCRRR